MRVIAGVAKGRRLISPTGEFTRPTADRMKEALFNIIGNQIVGCVFLDLFSGTGAIGIEALSRGASKCCFVDAHTAGLIEKNVALTRFQTASVIFSEDFKHATFRMAKLGYRFDIVFMDPPYRRNLLPAAMNLLLSHRLLAVDALIIAEHAADETPPEIDLLVHQDSRQYGSTVYQFFKFENCNSFGKAGQTFENRHLPRNV